MRQLERVAMWLRAIFAREHVETEMRREMRLHVEMETEQNIRLGMAPAEAKRRALVAFGGVEQTKEAVRDERRTRWLDDVASDLRYAVRGFRRQPGFTAGVVTLIALGVGANAAIFSVINHTLIAPLPYGDGNRMVEYSATAGGHQVFLMPAENDVDKWRAGARAVTDVIVLREMSFQLGDSTRGPTDNLRGIELTPGALAFVGMHPLLGRDIDAADTLSDAEPVALLGFDLWQAKFGGATDAVGRSVVLDGVPHRVVAVVPKGFKLPFTYGDQIFAALQQRAGNRRVSAIAKLRHGVSVTQANAELAAMFPHLDKTAGQDSPRVMREVDWVSPTTRRTAYLMFGAVMIVLIIACANVANLLLARAWTRQREFAIRAAMGAGRRRLARQVFTESLLLSLVGAVVALVVARLTLALLFAAHPHLVATHSQLDFVDARLDSAVLAWCFGVAIVTGLLFGLAPVLFVVRRPANDSLKAGSRAAAGSAGTHRVRSGLVVAEVALSAVLLVASGLMIRTVVAMQRADLGFDAHGLWAIRLDLGNKQIGDSTARRAAMTAALASVRAVPGVVGATMTLAIPPEFFVSTGQLEVEGRPVIRADSTESVGFLWAQPAFFAVSGVRILAGRAFADDGNANSRASVGGGILVSERMARRLWPNGDALGAKLRTAGGPWETVVGITANIEVPGDTRGRIQSQIYQMMPGASRWALLMVRTRAPIPVILPSITEAIRRASPLVAVAEKTTSAEAMISMARSTHRFVLILVGTFAAVALLLTAFGLHAVISYAVGQRTREIGVRIALGARSADVMHLVVGSGLELAVVGIVVGGIGGIATAAAMRAMLYHVAPADPTTLIAVSLLLAGVAVVATYVPTRRAMRIDPVEALRAD